jgi:hypothetical protein
MASTAVPVTPLDELESRSRVRAGAAACIALRSPPRSSAVCSRGVRVDFGECTGELAVLCVVDAHQSVITCLAASAAFEYFQHRHRKSAANLNQSSVVSIVMFMVDNNIMQFIYYIYCSPLSAIFHQLSRPPSATLHFVEAQCGSCFQRGTMLFVLSARHNASTHSGSLRRTVERRSKILEVLPARLDRAAT